MKIDFALKEFTEKYDREAMESVETISKDFGLNIHKHTIKLFDMKESFDIFSKYLRSYATYVTENVNNPQASPRESILASVDKFIASKLFNESEVVYSELPAFVESYVSGIKDLNSTIDEAKNTILNCEGADPVFAGDVNDFVEKFMTRLDESFTPAMDKILWASGYNSKQKLSGKKSVKKKPLFL